VESFVLDGDSEATVITYVESATDGGRALIGWCRTGRIVAQDPRDTRDGRGVVRRVERIDG